MRESPPTTQEDQLTTPEDQLETFKPTKTIETAKSLATPKSDDSETQKVSKAEQDKKTAAKDHRNQQLALIEHPICGNRGRSQDRRNLAMIPEIWEVVTETTLIAP